MEQDTRLAKPECTTTAEPVGEVQRIIQTLQEMMPDPLNCAEMVGAPQGSYDCPAAYENPIWNEEDFISF